MRATLMYGAGDVRALVEVCSIGLPGPHEVWIQALTRTAAFQAAKRAEHSERLFQRSTAGETDEYLPRAVVLRFVVGPARQLPQSPSPFPHAHRRRRDGARKSLDRGTWVEWRSLRETS